jgi:hypothetical protein
MPEASSEVVFWRRWAWGWCWLPASQLAVPLDDGMCWPNLRFPKRSVRGGCVGASSLARSRIEAVGEDCLSPGRLETLDKCVGFLGVV